MNPILLFMLALSLGPGAAADPQALDLRVLDLAVSGYERAVAAGQVPADALLTIIDYSRPSTERRLFVYDPQRDEVLHASLVAHGKNSGSDQATRFSNVSGSLCSSLGFFVTGRTYHGKHGYSLRLHGLEAGVNDNALARHIVMHGAGYVSQDFIAKHRRLGRSWGCPALPIETAGEVIDLIKDGSCLFVYSPDSTYLGTSEYIPSLPN